MVRTSSAIWTRCVSGIGEEDAVENDAPALERGKSLKMAATQPSDAMRAATAKRVRGWSCAEEEEVDSQDDERREGDDDLGPGERSSCA